MRLTAAKRHLAAALVAASAVPYLVDTLLWWRANAIGLIAFSLMMPVMAAAGCFLVRRDDAADPNGVDELPTSVLVVSVAAVAAAVSAPLVGQPILGAAGLWLSSAAVVGWLAGPGSLGRYLLPLAPLLLTAPLTAGWPARLEERLQRLSAGLAELWLGLLGVPAQREEAVVVVTPAFRNVVDDTCSGVGTFTALALYALLLGLLLRIPRGRLLAVMAFTLPLALLANGARIAWISVLGERGGAELAMGAMHEVTGYVVFAGSYALLLLGLIALRRAARPRARHVVKEGPGLTPVPSPSKHGEGDA